MFPNLQSTHRSLFFAEFILKNCFYRFKLINAHTNLCFKLIIIKGHLCDIAAFLFLVFFYFPMFLFFYVFIFYVFVLILTYYLQDWDKLSIIIIIVKQVMVLGPFELKLTSCTPRSKYYSISFVFSIKLNIQFMGPLFYFLGCRIWKTEVSWHF